MRQWGNIDRAPAGADTAAAVGTNIYTSCGTSNCCGGGEIQKGGGNSPLGINVGIPVVAWCCW